MYHVIFFQGCLNFVIEFLELVIWDVVWKKHIWYVSLKVIALVSRGPVSI